MTKFIIFVRLFSIPGFHSNNGGGLFSNINKYSIVPSSKPLLPSLPNHDGSIEKLPLCRALQT